MTISLNDPVECIIDGKSYIGKYISKKPNDFHLVYINGESVYVDNVTPIRCNIMFDLETLGNTNKAPIVQIGAVKFLDDGTIIDTFFSSINFDSLENYNFQINYSTLNWWFKQEDKAIKSLVESDKIGNIKDVLFDFKEWVGNPKAYVYWSHATFDPPILINSLVETGISNFIPYYLFRDLRTLIHFTGEIPIEREGIHHNALDDCLYQVKYASKAIQILNTKVHEN